VRRTSRSPGWKERPGEVFAQPLFQGGGAGGVFMGDADGGDAAVEPVSVAIFVVGFEGSPVMMRPVDLDDGGAAVTEHREVGAAYAGVAQLGGGQRQDGDGALRGTFPLEIL